MRVTLVCKGAQNLAIEALVPALKVRGHQVTVVYDPGLFDDKYFLNIPPLARLADQTENTVSRIIALKPDLIGFSVMSNLYGWALLVAGKIKSQSDVPIVFGGIHPSSAPEVVIAEKNVDFVVQGEADDALPDLAEALENHSDPTPIENVWTKSTKGPVTLRPLIQDLDALAPMDKTVFMEEALLRELCILVTSRGCPYSCAYCCHSYLSKLYKGKGRYLRRRSTGAVIEECERLKIDHGVKVLSFLDDVFTVDNDWLMDFAAQYKKRIGLPFLCNIHTRNCSMETGRLLKDMGCVRLDFGVQSMNELTRTKVLHRTSTNEEIKQAVEIFDAIKLPFHIHHIFGLPNDTESDYIEAANFYGTASQLVKINCFFLSYFPGTEILNYALKNEILTQEQAERFKHGEELNYYQGGSMPGLSPQMLAVAMNYMKLFVLIPMVPKSWTRWIVKRGKVHHLKYIPDLLTLILEVALVFIRGNVRVTAYMKYYAHHSWKMIKGKLRFKKE